MRGLGVLVLTLFAGTALAEQIPGSNIASGNWRGAAYTSDSTGIFSHCVVSAGYQSGDELYMSVNADATVTVGIYSTSWQLKSGETMPVTLRVDKRAPFTGTAVAHNPQFATLVIDDFEAAMTALRKGRALVVESVYGRDKYDLTGTNKALQVTLDCALKYLDYKGKPATTQPEPKAGTTAPPVVGGLLDPRVLGDVAMAILTDQGTRDASFFTEQEAASFLSYDTVIWTRTGDGSIGGVYYRADPGSGNLGASDQTDFQVITGCDGQVQTGARDYRAMGVMVRELSALCRTSGGMVETLMTKSAVGGQLLYTFFVFDGKSTVQGSEARRKLSERAAAVALSALGGGGTGGGPVAAPSGPARPRPLGGN